jgi:N-acetylglucosaminyl-diphospho-decaprenol L-rhamnosyltransferase
MTHYSRMPGRQEHLFDLTAVHSEAPAGGQPKSHDATVHVILVNWNYGGQLRECLESLVCAGAEPSLVQQVTVVDNASSDGSADGLDDLPLPLTLIRNTANRGFAAACNQAAAGSDADYLLFLNPDTRLSLNSISRPVQAMLAPENQAVGIVGVQLVDESGNVTPTCARFLTSGMVLRRILGLEHLHRSLWPPHVMTDWDHKASRMVDHVMGAFFLVRRDLFGRLGGMDERFFVYLEDLDFSLRARKAGYHTLYLTDTQVYHRGGGSSEREKARSLYYALSSRVQYGFKHFAPWKAWVLLGATLLVEPVTRVVHAAVRGSLSRVRDTLVAYAMLWRNFSDVLRARHHGQHL